MMSGADMAGLKTGLANIADGVRKMWNGNDLYKPPAWQEHEWAKARGEYATAIQLYQGQQLAILKQDIRERFHANTADIYLKQPTPMNITARVVDKLGMMYKAFPTFADAPEALAGQLTEDLGGWLKQADRISELCGICYVGPDWDEANGFMGITVIPPDVARPEWADDGTLSALSIYSSALNARGEKVTLRTEWTATTRKIFEGERDATATYGGEWADGSNPYGVLPFAVMRPRLPLVGAPDGHIREDLIQIQRTLNLKLTELQALISLQAGSQPFWTGDTMPSSVALGLGQVFHVPSGVDGQGGRLEYASPNARIAEVWNTINELIKQVAFLHNLSGQWGNLAPDVSGVALRIMNADLEEYRSDKEDAHRAFWFDFLAILPAFLSRHKVAMADLSGVRVEFCAPEVYSDPEVDQRVWAADVAAGIRSRLQWFMQFNEEYTEEAEAQAALDANLAAEGARKGATRPKPPGAMELLGEPTGKGDAVE